MSSRLCYQILIVAVAAIAISFESASAYTLVNPGFDDASPGLGPVGGFGTVVGPPFDDGFWGAENSMITSAGTGPGGPVSPLSAPYMLEMTDEGLTHTQAWQVVHVTPNIPNRMVGLSAMFTASSNSFGTVAGVQLRTFAQGSDWPTSSGLWTATGTLDGSGSTWEQISLAPVLIPANTEWILAEVFYVNSTLSAFGSPHGWVDNTELTIVPAPASLALMGLGVGAGLRRKRRK